MNRALSLTAILSVALFGCGQGSDSGKPSAPVSTSTPTDAAGAGKLTTDEQVMLALDCYDPMYQVDAKGRVVRLKLPWRHLPDSVLAEIIKLTELERLDCHAATITDDGLAKL